MNLLKSYSQQKVTSPPQMALSFRLLHKLVRHLPAHSKYQSDLVLFHKPLFPGVPEEENLEDGFTVRRAKKSDLQQIKNHPERFLPEVYMNRLLDDHGAFCVLKDDEVVSFIWYNFHFLCQFYGAQSQMCMGSLKKNTAFLYDLYTYRKYRGQGLAEQLLKYATAYFSNTGVAYLASCVSPSNPFALLLYKSCGFEPVDYFHLYRIERIKKCFRGTKRELNAIQQWMG